MNTLQLEVEALDPGEGYLIRARAVVTDPTTGAATRQKINEHRATEANVKARLATIWDWWAGQVDSE